MLERTGWARLRRHAVLVLGVLLVAFPVYIALVASTHPAADIVAHFPLWFGTRLISNYAHTITAGIGSVRWTPVVGQ